MTRLKDTLATPDALPYTIPRHLCKVPCRTMVSDALLRHFCVTVNPNPLYATTHHTAPCNTTLYTPQNTLHHTTFHTTRHMHRKPQHTTLHTTPRHSPENTAQTSGIAVSASLAIRFVFERFFLNVPKDFLNHQICQDLTYAYLTHTRASQVFRWLGRFILDVGLADQRRVPFFWAVHLFDSSAKYMRYCAVDDAMPHTAPLLPVPWNDVLIGVC